MKPTVVIPMAGSGARFVEAGYTDPKPIINVGGRTMISQVVEMFPGCKFVYVCNQEHLEKTRMREALESCTFNDQTIIAIPPHKLGPVYSCLFAFPCIPDNEPVIVSYCDGLLKFDFDEFMHTMERIQADGCLFTHQGFHPHTLSPTTKMAFVKLNVAGNVEAIKEKECYTDNPMNEPASSGVYYFRTGAILKKFFQMALDRKLHYHNEYYVTLVYNLLLEYKFKVVIYNTAVAILGTPEEVRNYEAWKQIVSSHAKTPENATDCYNFWKEFLSK